jgi:hypothetical protein
MALSRSVRTTIRSATTSRDGQSSHASSIELMGCPTRRIDSWSQPPLFIFSDYLEMLNEGSSAPPALCPAHIAMQKRSRHLLALAVIDNPQELRPSRLPLVRRATGCYGGDLGRRVVGHRRFVARVFCCTCDTKVYAVTREGWLQEPDPASKILFACPRL